MKTPKDLTHTQFLNALADHGIREEGFMGYVVFEGLSTHVSHFNAGPNRRAKLAFLLREKERLLAERDRDLLVGKLGTTFADLLKKELTPEQFAEMRTKNLLYSLDKAMKDVCASHDYCDANMVMLDAFVEHEMGAQFEPSNEEDCRLWNDAWSFAKRIFLTAKPNEVNVKSLKVTA